MKKIFAIAIALVLAIPVLAFADGNDVQIVVQGAAEVTAAPDMVKVTANAGVSGKTIAEAQADTNKIIDAVTRKLLELGVADDDIVTTSYAYYTTYDYSGESPVMNGYQANHTLSITCRDVDMLDSVVGVLVDGGMSECPQFAEILCQPDIPLLLYAVLSVFSFPHRRYHLSAS